MRIVPLAVLASLLLLVPSEAAGGIGVDAVTPSSVHAGEDVHVRISAGLRLWRPIPLYVVSSSKALRPRPCRGGRAVCEPKVPGPAVGRGYVRVATVSFRRVLRQRLTIEVPHVPPGRYEIAFYCGDCYKGPGGSLISAPSAAFTVVP